MIAVAMPENRASPRVMEKLGMNHERTTQKEGFAVVVHARSFAQWKNSAGATAI